MATERTALAIGLNAQAGDETFPRGKSSQVSRLKMLRLSAIM